MIFNASQGIAHTFDVMTESERGIEGGIKRACESRTRFYPMEANPPPLKTGRGAHRHIQCGGIAGEGTGAHRVGNWGHLAPCLRDRKRCRTFLFGPLLAGERDTITRIYEDLGMTIMPLRDRLGGDDDSWV